MDAKTKNKIINSLRRLSFAHSPRNEAKNLYKIDKATFQCEHCGIYCYEGKSDKNFQELQEKYGNQIIRGKVHLDHEPPVVPVEGWDNWDGYLERMFCDATGFQCLCEDCDEKKTTVEKALRMKYRQEKKK
jgi:hypothetical protein